MEAMGKGKEGDETPPNAELDEWGSPSLCSLLPLKRPFSFSRSKTVNHEF